ncbi:MAG TPA: ABC transporter permease [Candidatus Acidoferrales bacterium]|nr:ABC transporter permease [Candidatus Acidoferrales bacterium]
MFALRKFLGGLRALFKKEREEGELDEELRDFVEQRAATKMQMGLSRQQALREARMEMGSMDSVKERVRAVGWETAFNSFWQDIRFALRMLRKSPGFTTVAILTLALGIGANTAIFSVVNSLLLRPLPVEDPGEITVLGMQQKNEILSQYFSYPEYEDIREQSSGAFSGMLAYRLGLDGLSVNGQADHIITSFVTGNYFTMLGVKPFLGRLILPSEGKTPGADPVVVLGYDYWKNRFGGDRDVVGKSVSIDGHAFTIVGVTPKSFHGLNSILNMQAYMPMGMATIEGDFKGDFMADRNARGFIVFGRLKQGASVQRAETTLNVIAHRLSEEHREDEKDLALSVFPERLARPVVLPHNPIIAASALFLALAMLVLLLACFNVANLLLVRATVRQREMAIRAALGGTRARLIRQLLTESLILALLGGGAGIMIGVWGSAMIGSINFHVDLPIFLNFSFDWRVFTFAFVAAALTGIIVGIVPAFRASRSDLNELLHEGGRGVTGAHQRLRSVLVVAEISGSLMLLVVAGLFTRSLENAQHMSLGFDPEGVLNLTMDPHEVGYTEAQGKEFYKQLLERVRALPGVESASLAFSVPMGDTYTSKTIAVPGYTPPVGQQQPNVSNNVVTPGYFKTMRMPVVSGRVFSDADDEKAQQVAIVNQTMAKRFWPHEDAIGRTFWAVSAPKKPYRVVGVVKNAKYAAIFVHGESYFYVPLAQEYTPIETLQIRTKADPGNMAAEVQKEIESLAPTLPVFDVQTMEDSLGGGQGFLIFRLGAALAATLGILGLALVLVGIYGVVSYTASQRTHEIGIRMALGAQPEEIRRMVFRQGFFLVICGLAVGLLGSFAASRVVGNFLVGVSAVDPVIFGGVAVLLAVVTLAACYIPARRAMRVDPIVALRYE